MERLIIDRFAAESGTTRTNSSSPCCVRKGACPLGRRGWGASTTLSWRVSSCLTKDLKLSRLLSPSRSRVVSSGISSSSFIVLESCAFVTFLVVTRILGPLAYVDLLFLSLLTDLLSDGSLSAHLASSIVVLAQGLHEFEVVDTNQELSRDLAVRKR